MKLTFCVLCSVGGNTPISTTQSSADADKEFSKLL